MAALAFLGFGAPPATRVTSAGPGSAFAALTGPVVSSLMRISAKQAHIVTRSRVVDRASRDTHRQVFVVAVAGSSGCGKTALLRACANANGGSGALIQDPVTLRRSAVAAAEVAGGKRQWLVLQELAAGGADADFLTVRWRLFYPHPAPSHRRCPIILFPSLSCAEPCQPGLLRRYIISLRHQ
jgi:hypothetical protein